MSTVKLKKDRGTDKAGAVISVPFGVGQTLVANGEAEYPKPAATSATVNAPAPSVANVHAQEIARLNALHANAVRDLREQHEDEAKKAAKEHEAAVKKLTAELELAHATIADLNAKASHHKK